MATADQAKALIRGHADGDDTHFCAIAIQIATQAVRNEHSTFAQEPRELVDQEKARVPLPARHLDGRLERRSQGRGWVEPCRDRRGLRAGAKNAILDHSTSVRDAEFVAALEERRSMRQGGAV